MTDRFPLILDPSDIKLKELPAGDNLDLQGSGLVNANSITANSLTVNNISIDNQSLSAVAFSNDFNDLDNTPTGFSGDYQDLINKPSIPGILKDLNDVSGDQPTDGQALLYNDLQGEYIPSNVLTDIDLEDFNIGDLGNVIITGNVTDRFLKFTAGAWRPAKVQYSEVQDKPTDVSFFANDAGYITGDDIKSIDGDLKGSVFADDSTPLVDGINATLPYIPSTESNWQSPPPETVYEALDRLAAAVASLGTNA